MLQRLGLAALLVFAPAAFGSFAGLDAAGTDADRNATLNRLAPNFPKTLNPIIYSLAVEADIALNYTLFETLVTTDPDTGEAVCWLCEEFAYDPADKKIVTFKMRKDAKFHDGKPVTAHDVKFSFDVMVHPKVDNLNLKSGVLSTVEKVETIDDHTVKILFKAVRYANIYQVAVPVIPKHLFPYFEKNPENFNKDQKFGRAPVGSGPYKFAKWDGDKAIEVARNDDWWGFKDARFKNAFNFKRIRYKIVTNDNVQMQAFKKGEFDHMGLQSYQFDELRKEKGGKVEALHLKPKISTSWMYIAWNARLPKFADVKTRHGLALLTDRKLALEKFSKGLRPPTNGPWGIDSPEQCPAAKCPIPPFDPAAAKALLTEAGWADTDKDGCLDRPDPKSPNEKQVLKFSILSDDSDWSKNVLSVYTTEMKKAGVCAEIRQLDWTAMSKLVDDLNFEAYISGFRNDFPNLPRQLWHSSNTGKTGSNSWGFVDADADKMIDSFETEFDSEKRKVIGQQLHEKIYNAWPVVWHHEGGGCFDGRSNDLLGVTVADFMADCTYWPRWYKKKK